MAESQKYYLGDTLINHQYLGDNPTIVLSQYTPTQDEAQEFLTATGITDPTISSAINTLVFDMKTAGIWGKMVAVYPFVGGTATTHKYNLKNAQDTQAAFAINGLAAFTNDSDGITAPGVGSANTFVGSTSDLTTNDVHVSIYVGTDVAANNNIDIGAVYEGRGTQIFTRNASDQWGSKLQDDTNNVISNTDSRGFYQISRDNSSSYYAQKNTTRSTVTQTTAQITIDSTITIGSLAGNGPTTRNYRFISLGTALTTSEMDDFYTLVQTFQTSLSRQV